MGTLKVIGSALYQWEIGRKIRVLSSVGDRAVMVQFAHPGDKEALSVTPREENGVIVADVPNILLQSGDKIVAFLVEVDESCVETTRHSVFHVVNRPKPADYVYTETEVLNYHSLVSRIDQIERNGVSDEQIATAVDKYLEENPVQVGATKEEAEQIQQNKEDIEQLALDKLDADKLPEAINDALAQAKASGEFDGDILVVTVENPIGNTVASHTASEIKAASNEGKAVFLKADCKVYPCVSLNGSSAKFELKSIKTNTDANGRKESTLTTIAYTVGEDATATMVMTMETLETDPSAIVPGGGTGGGLSETAKNLLITILRNGEYSTDQSDNITALAAELGVTEEEPDIDDNGGLNITDDNNGNVTIESTGSASITDDGSGNVIIEYASITDDGNGNVTIV